MKKVIFIGGTSYSGSTFFDMILANDTNGFSCGEVSALFKPFRSHHINPECGCGKIGCDIWQSILITGKDCLYETIFELLPNIDFIVDSSKNPFWIQMQTRLLKKKNIHTKNILIWKSPLEAACSFHKRKRLQDFKKSWINYHRLYFSLINNYKTVKYYDFANNKNVLKELCDYLDIPFFVDKEKYWENTHHTLFGNTSAKIHLYHEDDQHFKKSKAKLAKRSGRNDLTIKKEHKKIYYEKIKHNELALFVQKQLEKNNRFKDIITVLEKLDILHSQSEEKTTNNDTLLANRVKMPLGAMYLRRIQEELKITFARFRF